MFNEIDDLWGKTVSYINRRSGTDQSQIGSFLAYLRPEALSDSELVVSTNNKFAKTWIEKYYYNDIKDALFNVIGLDYGFRIVVSELEDDRSISDNYPSQRPPEVLKNSLISGDNNTFSAMDTPAVTLTFDVLEPTPTGVGINMSSGQITPISKPVLTQTSPTAIQTPISPLTTTQNVAYLDPFIGAIKKPLSDQRTFESFIVGDSNRYAFSAALGVAKSPGNIYNPLFIYGGSGLGKTHLLLAIENYIHENHAHLKSTYAQTSDFVRDFTSMIYNDEKRRIFDQQYRQVDIILLDDVQYLEGKEGTTGEVFQIFNDFTAQNKQIVLSADRPPKNIQLDERYKSRFASGITIDIQPPNFETKHAIFENYLDFCCRKLEKPEIRDLFREDIVDMIIDLSSDNIRELEGAIATCVARISERQRQYRFNSLTVEEVELWISNVFMRAAEKHINVALIQKEVEKFYHVSHDDLISKKRSQGITYPRQVAMYLSRSMTGESYPDIGKAFGGKDHTSVMYACNNIEQKRQLSKTVESEIKNLVEMIRK